MHSIGPYCKMKQIYVHVDAAYAGAAFICPEYQHYLAGVESVDSLVINPHKWLQTSFDCSVMWFKNKNLMMDNYNTDATYILPFDYQNSSKKSINSLRNCSIQFSRKFRAFKLWMVLTLFGTEYFQNYIRSHIKWAKKFESYVLNDNRFEIVEDVVMGFVCFRLKGDNKFTKTLLQMIYDKREIYLVPSQINDIFFLRYAIGGNSQESDVSDVWNHIQSLTNIMNEIKCINL